jgi:hypothetical protein
MEIGEVICQTKGIIHSVYDRAERVGKNGPFTVQNCILMDGNTKVKAAFWNRDEMRPMMGKTVWLISTPGKGGKLGGVTVKDGSFTKKDGTQVNEKVIDVSQSANIGLSEKHQPDADEIPMGDESSEEATLPTPPPAEPKPKLDGPMPVYGATVGCCLKEACSIVNSLGTDPFNPEYFKQVYQIASDLIRVARMLEKGELSPSAKQRQEGK